MDSHAEKLRSLDPFHKDSVGSALMLLEEVQVWAEELGETWGIHVADAASWGQGALVASVEGDDSIYEYCLYQIEECMGRADSARQPN